MENNANDNVKKKGSKALIITLAIVTAAAIGVTIWALFLRDNTSALLPDYAPKATDSHAQKLPDDDEGKLDQPEGGGAVSLTYSTEVLVSLSTNEATIFFQNPSRSNQNMMLQIVVQDKVVAQSDLLPPGYKLETMPILDAGYFQEGIYEGKFNILYFDSETGERAILNTEIPVSITVSK